MHNFFTADYHLNHANMIKYCARTLYMTKDDLDKYNYYKDKSKYEQKQFIVSKESLLKMNNGIRTNHNSRVKPGDTVFHIGDFLFKNSIGGKEGEGLPVKASELLPMFNGKFIFILGNHDRNNSLKTPITNCRIRIGNKNINLVHNPQWVDMNCEINLVGHVHTDWKFKRIIKDCKITDAINVGVDQWNFYPITFEEILSKYNKWKRENNYK
jgi:calcineurin-like phosphoesterase family protein